MTHSVAAVDLGATSGRVMVGHVGPNELRLEAVSRFANGGTMLADGLHWNVSGLFEHAVAGLTEAASRVPGIASIGVDSWAVDYALLDGDRMLCEPFHYRDDRTAVGVERVHARVTPADLYARNGLQFLPFNTVYQLAAELRGPGLSGADSMLLVPDLLNYWMTGNKRAERTNASTTGLLPVGGNEWDLDLMHRVGLPSGILPTLINAGDEVGPLLSHLVTATGLGPSTKVIAVGSHDTASAVVAAPMQGDDAAYISCGTWGLVGLELDSPVVTERAREANFTNERGVDGTTRFLHNVMGLWLLSETMREWEAAGSAPPLTTVLAQAADVTRSVPVFDANDPRFLAPGPMTPRIIQWCAENHVAPPASQPEFVRSIIESLADAFALAIAQASELAGRPVRTVHIVGGGSLNELLCQRTADRLGLTVVAGPVEATAIGNVLIQARALGAVDGTLEGMRELVRKTFAVKRYTPKEPTR
ncbi:rhamnulokinase [Demequina oxidasica]|uniref:rhamnulokinase n=1 Tax=Demequina oxidasica TaxID=676199 RepID=UPI00191BE8C5|nr:rhamnulokinase family protein [Demequina oxidasica]